MVNFHCTPGRERLHYLMSTRALPILNRKCRDETLPTQLSHPLDDKNIKTTKYLILIYFIILEMIRSNVMTIVTSNIQII